MSQPRFSHFVRTALLFIVAVAMIGTGKAFAQTVPTPEPSRTQNPVPTVVPQPLPPITPPQEPLPAGSILQVIPAGAPVDVAIGNGSVHISIPLGANSVPGTLVATPINVAAPLQPNDGTRLLGIPIELHIYDANGVLIEHPIFAVPVQICFAASPEDLAAASANPNAVQVQFYDTLLNPPAWVSLPTSLGPNGTICGSTTHFTLFSLAAVDGSAAPVANTEKAAMLPNTGDSAGTNAEGVTMLPNTGEADGSDIPLWIGLGALVLGTIGGVLRVRARRAAK